MDFATMEDFAELRRRMVHYQLRRRGIDDPRVLDAMECVPRHEFVPPTLREQAYDDCALPIGLGQTISQPYTVAFMLQILKPLEHERVLEIGTGTGYNAALLSQLAREVHSVERISVLAESASQRLQRLGYHNVQVHCSDGTLGWSEAAPYDGMIITAGAASFPDAYPRQLGPHGRIVIPIGGDRGQVLCRYESQNGRLQVTRFGTFAFVPLIGAEQSSLDHVPESPRSESRENH
jgi:protein-L-isoaspartate(D-aspartate) O-methyltransferase